MPNIRLMRPRSPRSLVAVALSLAVLLAGCSSDSDSSGSSDTGTGSDAGSGTPADAEASGWTFTDSAGVEHHLDEVPDVIAAQSTVAGGLWEYGVVADAVFGPLRRADGSPDPSLGLASPDDFTSVGELEADLNIEAIAAAQPDLVVVPMWDESTYWGIPENLVDEVEALAPIIGIRLDDTSMPEPLGSLADLALSLGADEAKVDEAKAEFDAASESLRTAAEGNPDLLVGATSGTLTEMYVAYPPSFPDLRYYQELGLNMVEPVDHPTSDGHWETLSWETANKYPVDLIIADSRAGTVDDILKLLPEPALLLPAIEQGQITSWITTHAIGYRSVAKNLTALAEAVRDADPAVAS